jgi:hypothetical protein
MRAIMKKLSVLAFLLAASPVLAQTAAKPYVPFTVDERSLQELQRWLNEQPFKFSAPVIEWLNAQKQRAVDEKATEEAKKAKK